MVFMLLVLCIAWVLQYPILTYFYDDCAQSKSQTYLECHGDLICDRSSKFFGDVFQKVSISLDFLSHRYQFFLLSNYFLFRIDAIEQAM